MHRTISISLCSAGLLALLVAPVSAGSIKCWTNKHGVRECGSIIPPEYVSREHELRDSQGEVIQEVQAEKSVEERRAILEKQRAEEEAKRRKERQEKEDQALLDAYPTAGDILIACNGKAASVDAAVQVAENQVEFYKKSLREAEELRDRTKKPSDDLLLHIKAVKRQLRNFERTIDDKLREKEYIKTEHQKYLHRYQEVKHRLTKKINLRVLQQAPEGTDNACELKFKQFDEPETTESLDEEVEQ